MVLYQVIVEIVRTKPESTLPSPDMPVADEEGNEPSEEDKATVTKQIDAIAAQNAEIEKRNEALAKIQSKIKIVERAHVKDTNECGLLRVNNYREPRPNEISEPSIEADPGTNANTSIASGKDEEQKVDSAN